MLLSVSLILMIGMFMGVGCRKKGNGSQKTFFEIWKIMGGSASFFICISWGDRKYWILRKSWIQGSCSACNRTYSSSRSLCH